MVKDEAPKRRELEPTKLFKDYCGECGWKCSARSGSAIADSLHAHFGMHFDQRKTGTE